METEVWKPVVGYEGMYEVSNLGKIKSLLDRHRKERIFKPASDRVGYLYCGIRKNGIIKSYKMHRLVALAFIPNPKNKPQVNHKNGIKGDNRLENLEWCTSSENNRHAYATGLKVSVMKGKFGKDSPSSKSVDQFTREGYFIRTWGSAVDVKRELGIARSSISSCISGKLKSAGGFIWKFS